MRKYLVLCFSVLLTLPAAAQRFEDAAFPGGVDSMVQFFNRHINIPAGLLTEKGTVATVQFEVNTKGKITHLRTQPEGSTDAYAAELLRVAGSMPQWQPGYIGGVKATVAYTISGRFMRTTDGDSGRAVFQLEVPPRFPGGIAGLMEFVKQTMRYPKLASTNRAEGRVRVSFDVEADGYLANIAIISETIGYDLEQEAIRVVEAMPRWQPAIKGNKRPTVNHKLPINFSLQARR